MGFAHSDLDERAQARTVARHIGSEHEEIVIAPREVTDDLAKTIACFDDLFADWGTISTRLLYERCRERGIKVVLVGEGADELFGGYENFRSSASRAPYRLVVVPALSRLLRSALWSLLWYLSRIDARISEVRQW